MPRKEQPRVIEAVIKVTEVCNINCTYCYVFSRGDESHKRHDKCMKADTVDYADVLDNERVWRVWLTFASRYRRLWVPW